MSTDASMARYNDLIVQYITLLERQIIVEVGIFMAQSPSICLAKQRNDTNASDRGDARFRMYPKSASVIGQSVLTTLYYLCLYHYHDKEVQPTLPWPL